MLIQFQLNGKDYPFGTLIEDLEIIQIRTLINSPIIIQKAESLNIKRYLNKLIDSMSENGYVIYNDIICYKKDINKINI